MLIRDCSSLQSLGHLLHWTKQNLEVPIVRLTKSQENSCLQVGGRISPVCLPKQITKKKKKKPGMDCVQPGGNDSHAAGTSL